MLNQWMAERPILTVLSPPPKLPMYHNEAQDNRKLIQQKRRAVGHSILSAELEDLAQEEGLSTLWELPKDGTSWVSSRVVRQLRQMQGKIAPRPVR